MARWQKLLFEHESSSGGPTASLCCCCCYYIRLLLSLIPAPLPLLEHSLTIGRDVVTEIEIELYLAGLEKDVARDWPEVAERRSRRRRQIVTTAADKERPSREAIDLVGCAIIGIGVKNTNKHKMRLLKFGKLF